MITEVVLVDIHGMSYIFCQGVFGAICFCYFLSNGTAYCTCGSHAIAPVSYLSWVMLGTVHPELRFALLSSRTAYLGVPYRPSLKSPPRFV